jgi:hypothetical protein
MELTKEQQATLAILNLEVAGQTHNPDDCCLGANGSIWRATTPGEFSSAVVVRPAHAAKVAELEREVSATNEIAETNYHRHKNAEHKLRLADEHNGCLLLKVAALESDVARLNQMIRDGGQGQGAIDAYAAQCEELERLEAELAPIRALKVGSWRWAMVQLVLGKVVSNKWGCLYRIREGKIEQITNDPEDVWTPSSELYGDGFEPYTLHTAPEPAPTADELAAAIEGINSITFAQHTLGEISDIGNKSLIERVKSAYMLAARYRAAKEAGDGR